MNTVLVTEELTGGHYLFKKGCDIVFVTALLIIIDIHVYHLIKCICRIADIPYC